jgi:hypothetical protein
VIILTTAVKVPGETENNANSAGNRGKYKTAEQEINIRKTIK